MIAHEGTRNEVPVPRMGIPTRIIIGDKTSEDFPHTMMARHVEAYLLYYTMQHTHTIFISSYIWNHTNAIIFPATATANLTKKEVFLTLWLKIIIDNTAAGHPPNKDKIQSEFSLTLTLFVFAENLSIPNTIKEVKLIASANFQYNFFISSIPCSFKCWSLYKFGHEELVVLNIVLYR